MTASWEITVQNFLSQLEKEEGFHSVKALCKFVIKPYVLDDVEKPYKWKDQSEFIEYLKDYADISLVHEKFHTKWIRMENMKNIAEYDKKEAEKVQELIELLSN